MKRIISLLLAIAMLFGIGCVTNVSAATKNYCKVFEDYLTNLSFVNSFGDEDTPWSASDIAFITARQFPDIYDYYNKNKSTQFEDVYSFPKKKFESLAKKLFDVKVDLTTANYSGMQKVVYDAQNKKYDLVCLAAGGGCFYEVYGYKALKSNKYSVYLSKSDDWSGISEYALATVKYSGKHVKIISCKKIEKLPSKSKLITPLQELNFKKSYLKSNSSAYLSWNKISGAKKYKLQYKISGSKSWKTVTTTKTSATVKKLKAGKKYYFKVSATTKNGTSVSEAVSLYTLKKLQAKAKSKTKTTVTLGWNRNKNADGYIVYKRNSKKADWKAVKTIKKNSTVKYKVTKLKSKKTVYFKVVSYKNENGKKVKSSGETFKVKTK